MRKESSWAEIDEKNSCLKMKSILTKQKIVRFENQETFLIGTSPELDSRGSCGIGSRYQLKKNGLKNRDWTGAGQFKTVRKPRVPKTREILVQLISKLFCWIVARRKKNQTPRLTHFLANKASRLNNLNGGSVEVLWPVL